MDILIGGLLVFTLISAPLTKVDFMAYEIYKTQTVIVNAIQKLKENDFETTNEEINDMLDKIVKNTAAINGLLREKNDFNSKINSVMSMGAMSNKRFNMAQMQKFQEYTKLYKSESAELQKKLSYLNDKKIGVDLSNKILEENGEIDEIYTKLQELNNIQVQAISSLNSIINDSHETYDVLCA